MLPSDPDHRPRPEISAPAPRITKTGLIASSAVELAGGVPVLPPVDGPTRDGGRTRGGQVEGRRMRRPSTPEDDVHSMQDGPGNFPDLYPCPLVENPSTFRSFDKLRDHRLKVLPPITKFVELACVERVEPSKRTPRSPQPSPPAPATLRQAQGPSPRPRFVSSRRATRAGHAAFRTVPGSGASVPPTAPASRGSASTS